MNSETINLVNATYAQTGASAKTDKLGMREMQARAFEKRNAPKLLIKAPPASEKSRALIFNVGQGGHGEGQDEGGQDGGQEHGDGGDEGLRRGQAHGDDAEDHAQAEGQRPGDEPGDESGEPKTVCCSTGAEPTPRRVLF